MRGKSKIIFLALLTLALSACQPAPTPTPTPEIVPSPTATSTPTQIPTSTATPTATFTPTPTYPIIDNGAITFWSDSEKGGNWALYRYDIQDNKITKLTDFLFRLEGFGANDPNVISYLGGASYQLSVDGQYVAASYAWIFNVVDVSTREDIPIMFGHNHFDTALAWHPTKLILAYDKKGLQLFDGNTQTTERISNLDCSAITWDIATEGIICSTGWEIYYIPLESRNPVELVKIERQGELYDIQVTEDGTTIFMRRTNKMLYMGTMSRNEPIELQNFLEPYHLDIDWISNYSLNPQGKFVAVDIENHSSISNLLVLDFLTNSIICEAKGYIRYPTWTNDGKLLMYVVNYEGLHKIKFMDVENNCQIVKEIEIDGRATDIQWFENE